MSEPTTSIAMSAVRSTRERQPPHVKKSPPPAFTSFFSVNKSSSASLRSIKPAEMQNSTTRTKGRRPKRCAVKNRSSERINTIAPAPKIEEVPVSPVQRPNVFAFMEEEQADETVPEPDQHEAKDEEDHVEEGPAEEEPVEEESVKEGPVEEEPVEEESVKEGPGEEEPTEEEPAVGSPQAPPYSISSPTRSESDASEDSQRTRVEEYILQSSSFHSDSGISMGSGSSEYDSPVLSYKVPHTGSSCTRAEDVDAAQPTPTATCVNTGKDGESRREVDEEPEAFYASARQLPFDPPNQRPANPRRPSLPRSSRSERRGSRPQQGYTKRGYDLLASNISSNNTTVLKPLYRRFEAFNNRILLYLQDEITEMEEELRELDTAIARESEAMGNRMASRRIETRGPSQLQWRRLELLSRSFAKIEQYNCALSSYSKLAQNVEPASRADVATYRNWMAKRTPIAGSETKFLQNEADLLSVGPTRKRGIAEGRVVTAGFALLALILIFKATPQIFARLVISAIMGLAALCTLCPSVMTDMKRLGEMGRVMGLYATLMLVLSVVIS